MKIFRPMNIFTALVVLLVFAFAFRLVNVLGHRGIPVADIGIFMPAGAEEGVKPVSEEPPPLTQADVSKAVQDTAAKAEQPAPAAKAAQAEEEEPANPPPVYNTSSSFSASEVEVLQSLARRRDELDKREKEIADRAALLDAAEQQVDRKIAELNKLKGEIVDLLGQQKTQEDDRIKSLVKIYEGMKPKEAAVIFNALDMSVLMPVISRMNERKSGPILAAMEPEKARLVTIRLAEQKKLPVDGDAAPAVGN